MRESEQNSIIRLLGYSRPYVHWMVLTLLVSMTDIALTILSSWFLGRISETAIAMDFSQFVSTLVPILIVFVLQTPIAYINTYALAKFSEHSIFDLRNRVMQHIQSLSLEEIEKNSSDAFEGTYCACYSSSFFFDIVIFLKGR